LNLPLGYRYAATHAGIRKDGRNDLGLIVSEPLAHGAAVFTQNVVQAAPVRLARKHLKSSRGRVAAILVNAGNANCATKTGDRVALACCKAVAKASKTRSEYVLPASTGVIGVELDPKRITNAIPGLTARLSSEAFEHVAHAILTTDTRAKCSSRAVQLRGGLIRIAGMTKGAGMIHPHMATTLGFVLTDAALEAKHLRDILVDSMETSYNSLTVDGDMSTNDMVVLLANGASGVRPRKSEFDILRQQITSLMQDLAGQIAADGEGARKQILVRAQGFKTVADARRIARSVANSLLVKTAVTGSDPNWGRILAAAGYAGVDFDSSKIDIYLQRVLVCRGGVAADFDESEVKQGLDERQVEITIVLTGNGKAGARFFTCDLTEDYIRINGSYRT
jgi:glutamate N-acetyltransferase / amino-acid N-acetyltransferase